MDNKLLESYLDHIAGQVIDEDKIVTYKSLSKSLNIHVNTAKQLLYTYLKNEKEKSTFPISATYLIAGKVIDGSFNISIVNESDLKKAHSSLVEVTSEHVYSVQKGKNVKEIKFLSGVGKELPTSNSSRLVIKFSSSVLKQREVKKKPQSDETENQKLIKEALISGKDTKDNIESNQKIITATDGTTQKHKKTSPKGNSVQGSVRKPAGNIANLFAKANQKNLEKSEKTETDSIINKSKSVVDVGIDDKTKDELKSSDRGTSEKSSELKESLTRRKSLKKRKRIQMVSDSEESGSDDAQFVDMDLDEEHNLPPVLNFEEEIKENKESISKNKRKKRKVIDKTVMNEDGYLETKKEVVFETDSENETEEEPKPKEEKKPKIERATDKGKGAKKQSSLLSFFNKKS